MNISRTDQLQDSPPFAFKFTPALSAMLWEMGITLAFSTYQAGKVVFLSASPDGRLIQLPRTFYRPMGLALSGNRLAVASQWAIEVLENCPSLAYGYPQQPNTYDALYVPRATYYTGHNNMHDIEWGRDALWGVNTAFSCLCTIGDQLSFKHQWHPAFITELRPEDRCHLNGMAMQEGVPRFVTALGTGDSEKSWRPDRLHSGVIMHVPSGDFLATHLPIPHSPRMINGDLYLLLSATGELVRIDTCSGKRDTVAQCNGYVRGLDYYNGLFFVGISKVREECASKYPLPILQKGPLMTGIVVINAATGNEVARVEYASSVEDIYDVKVLKNMRRPGILNTANEYHKRAIVTEETSYWAELEN